MTNDIETINSPNDETFTVDIDSLDETAAKEKLREVLPKWKETSESNRQLFARAKKAEGFELKDGKWLKQEKPEPKAEPKAPVKPDDKLLERLDKMALKLGGINEADEVELFNNWKEQTGREADAIVGNTIFKKEIEDLRTAKANLKATSDIKGEGDRSGGAKNTPEYWIAKATKGKDGKLEFPEETPKELYSKILNKMSAGEPNSSGNLKFYNE